MKMYPWGLQSLRRSRIRHPDTGDIVHYQTIRLVQYLHVAPSSIDSITTMFLHSYSTTRPIIQFVIGSNLSLTDIRRDP
jgi:hypothetical protein